MFGKAKIASLAQLVERVICNLEVVGSSPTRGSKSKKVKGVFQSGQMGQTVNLLRQRFGGSNPSAPTQK